MTMPLNVDQDGKKRITGVRMGVDPVRIYILVNLEGVDELVDLYSDYRYIMERLLTTDMKALLIGKTALEGEFAIQQLLMPKKGTA